jgi:hypothetical protein
MGRWQARLKDSCRAVLGLVLAAILQAGTAQAAGIAVCGQTAANDGSGKLMYAEDGQPLSLLVTETPLSAPGCSYQELPVPAASIRWLSLTDIPLTADAPAALTLLGLFRADTTAVSEVLWGAEPLASDGILPFSTNSLPLFEAHAFGVEERAALADNFSLACAPGQQVAGIYLQTASQWENAGATDLELAVSGTGDFQLAIADQQRQASQAPLVLGTLVLRDEPQARIFRYRLPANRAPWQRLTLLCPATSASLTIESLALIPEEVVVPRSRAAWVWSPAAWRENQQQLWALATREGLNRLYLTVPVDAEGAVEQPEELAQFITAAAVHAVEIWPVIGDPRDVLEKNLPALQARVVAYLAYNDAAAANARLAGLQLDIEPHLLPGFGLAHAYWRERWLHTVGAVHSQIAGRLPLDLVVPVWWGSHPAWSDHLLSALAWPDLSLTIMNYRTSAAPLRAGALPFLVWGQHSGVPVTMALELGSIGPDEQRRSYARSEDNGELWLLKVGAASLLVLLDAPVSGMPGLGWQQQGESLAAVSAITFGGDQVQMQALATAMEAEWRLWSSYAGLAIHGFEESYLQLPTAGD